MNDISANPLNHLGEEKCGCACVPASLSSCCTRWREMWMFMFCLQVFRIDLRVYLLSWTVCGVVPYITSTREECLVQTKDINVCWKLCFVKVYLKYSERSIIFNSTDMAYKNKLKIHRKYLNSCILFLVLFVIFCGSLPYTLLWLK